jgi:beta-glucanase (GH16 family)
MSAAMTMAVGLIASGAVAVAALLSGGNSRQDASAAARTPAKWKRVFSESFDHGLDRSRWGAYSGQPGGDPGGYWDPSHVKVRKGVLNLETYRDPHFGNRWVSGGVSSSHALRQRYGKYEVRFRMDAGKGVAGIMLLWPVADHWPPEVDFAEAGGATGRRDSAAATLHYGPENRQIQRTLGADLTRWHTAGVEWTPGRLVYTIDGHPWSTVRSRHVPSERMELDIQSQAGTCGDSFAPCPDSSTPKHVNLQIDRVTAYRYVPGAR